MHNFRGRILSPARESVSEVKSLATATTTPFLTAEQYLKTVYRPDVDYVDGYIEERNLGEFDHGTLVLNLAQYFLHRRREWNIHVALDTRMQITPTRFRVPDIGITSLAAPKKQILRTPPLLCIEVLCPEDTLRTMRRRVEDYFSLGVPHVWIFDFQLRNVTVCHPNGADSLQFIGSLTLPGTPIAIPLEQIFAALDED